MLSERDNLGEITKRRFGSRFDQPCNDPNVLECAMFECQKVGYCQKGHLTGIGSQVIRVRRSALEDQR